MVSSHNYYRLAASVALFIAITWLLLYHLRVERPLFKTHTATHYDALSLDRPTFVKEWLVAPGEISPEQSSVYRICNQPHISWRPNLILRLDDANGGIGNVRGNFLDFLYFAIQMGASIVLPTSAKRSSTDLGSLFNGRNPFDAFFDKDHFLDVMQRKCPRMEILLSEKGHDLPEPVPGRYLMPSMRTDIYPDHTIEWAREQFQSWLVPSFEVPIQPVEIESQDAETNKGATRDTNLESAETKLLGSEDFPITIEERDGLDLARTKVLVNLQRTLWEGPDTRAIPAQIRRDFGALLRINPRARRLAAIATYNLAQQHQMHLDPRRPYYPNAFYGAHLRTESDAANAGWLDANEAHANFSSQATTYLDEAKRHNLGIIYCASGSPADLVAFTELASTAYNITVTHKAALLSSFDLFDLQQLTWDQQALVDYEILGRSSYFGGFVRSSFSYNIAMKRNVFVEQEGLASVMHWYRPEDMDGTLAFRDALSTVWGRFRLHEDKIPRGMWP